MCQIFHKVVLPILRYSSRYFLVDAIYLLNNSITNQYRYKIVSTKNCINAKSLKILSNFHFHKKLSDI
jgi:hypothetical protein